jgi:uncharacterized membrane protein
MNINHPSKGESGINAILARNIDTLLEERRTEERRASTQQKVADAITRFAGSCRLYIFTRQYLDCGGLSIWGG